MIIVGMQFGHDGGVCITKDGKILSYIYRERQNRVKHSIGISTHEINLALKQANITHEDIDAFAISSTQGLELLTGLINDFEIALEKHKNDTAPSPLAKMMEESYLDIDMMLVSAMNQLFKNAEQNKGSFTFEAFSKMCPEKDKIIKDEVNYTGWLNNYIQTERWTKGVSLYDVGNQNANGVLSDDNIKYGFHYPVTVNFRGKEVPGYFICHHMAHAASSYYRSHFDEAAIFTHDGFDSGANYQGGIVAYGKGHEIFPVTPHHINVGSVYETTAMFLGLGVGSSGKLMGLAPYGKPRFFNQVLVGNAYDIKQKFNADIDELWRNHCIDAAKKMGYDMTALADQKRILEPINIDIAASTQKLFEECYLHGVSMASQVLVNSGINTRNLCLSGGTALNCPSNSKVYRESPFDNVFVEPHCPDDGLAIGSALYVYHHLYGNQKAANENEAYASAYLGPDITESEVLETLNKFGTKISFEKLEDATKQAANDVHQNKVIAWFEGKSECGPRALGHRSIISNPTYANNWARVNEIKHREWWRPFAPSVLEEEADKWFIGLPKKSPYMLFTGQVLQPEKIPAITHVDNSSRIQTVDESTGQYYHMIKEFHKLSGVPLVMNTSFNGPGEPIIETPEQAVNFLLETKLDALYIDGYKVRKK